MVMFVIAKVRLGSDGEHMEWDAREELRPILTEVVKEVLGKKGDAEFIHTLLCDSEVVSSLRRKAKGKLAALIKQKRETYLPSHEKRKMLNLLKAVAKVAFGDNTEISDQLIQLLEDKNIMAATKAFKVSRENNDDTAMMAALPKLLTLLGKVRYDLILTSN